LEYHQLTLWFGTFVATVYGLLIGSFINVCIYRLPPRIFYFDDLFFESGVADLFEDVKIWLHSVFGKSTADLENLEPFLYAEPFFYVCTSPETTAMAAAVSHSYNLYKYAVPERITIVRPRSFCPSCGKMIRWWMNIPVISYLILRGKCYYCKAKISPRYLLNEILSGFFCGFLFYMYGLEHFPVFLFYYILAAVCLVVFFIDFDQWLILDEVTLPFTLVGIIGSSFIPLKFFAPVDKYLGFSLLYVLLPRGLTQKIQQLVQSSPAWLHPDSLLRSVIAAAGSFLIFYSIAVVGTYLAGREAMGGGDLKFAMLMGAFLGPQKTALAFFLATFSGTAFMLPGLLLGEKTGKDQVPFGCFLALGTVLTVFIGEKLVEMYFKWSGFF